MPDLQKGNGPMHARNRAPDARYVDKGLGTQCLHAGELWEKQDFWSSSAPIYNGTVFFYDTVQEREDAVYNRRPGYSYSRNGSPTLTTLERALSTLEGAEVTKACGSGMAASHLVMVAFGGGRDGLILSSSDVYGSVSTMVQNIFPELGSRTILMDFTDLNRLEDVMSRERPSMVYFEAVTNPLTKVLDVPAIVELAHHFGALVNVDNTFTTPYLLKPFEYGADFVSHSLSKFLNGHADVLGGSVGCNEQHYARLHDIHLQLGATLAANEAWLCLRGLKTFQVRMERHCANAMEIASFLEKHPMISRVLYPGLPSHPQHEIAKRILKPKGFGAMLAFDVAGCDTVEKAYEFMDALKVIMASSSLGDVYSVIVNPARSTHHWFSEEELRKLGIGIGTFRMSVGLEDVEDIKEDLDQALRLYQQA